MLLLLRLTSLLSSLPLTTSQEFVFMAILTVRNLDEAVVRRLRIQAAENGRSAEAEHREILRAALVGSAQPAPPQQTHKRVVWPQVERDRPPTSAELQEQAHAVRRIMEMG
jgi:plasmid stability protein